MLDLSVRMRLASSALLAVLAEWRETIAKTVHRIAMQRIEMPILPPGVVGIKCRFPFFIGMALSWVDVGA